MNTKSRSIRIVALAAVIATAGCGNGPKDPFTYAFGKISDGGGSGRNVVLHPKVTKVFPPEAGSGESVTVWGEDFGSEQGNGTLTLGDTEIKPTLWSDGQIQFLVDEFLAGGPQDIVVKAGLEKSAPFKIGISPTLSKVNPGKGIGGSLLKLAGTNFGEKQGKGVVKASGVTMQPKTWSTKQVTVIIPDTLDPGRKTMQVDIGGIRSKERWFTVLPSLVNVTPTGGVVESSVTITGRNFGANQGDGTVSIGGENAAVTSWGAKSIRAVVPFGLAPGVHPVVVRAADNATGEGSYAVVVPALAGLSPQYAFAGAVVTITGANFGAAQHGSLLLMDGLALTPDSWSNGQITFTVPASLPGGTHTVALRVGIQTTSSAALTVRPTLTQVRPLAGPEGTWVVVEGYGFGTTGVVALGATPVVPLSWSATSVVFNVPAGLPAGMHMITVSTGGQVSGALPFTLTLPGAAVIQSLVPSVGMAGTTVGVFGLNLGATAGGAQVGGVPVTSTVWTPALVNLTIPALPTGTHDVILTVGGVPTNALPFTVTSPTSPWIYSVSPPNGVAGTRLAISGVKFGASGTVSVGGASAAIVSYSATSILAVVPANVAAGVVPVVVTANGEASNSVLFVLAPYISGLNPTGGATSSSITINGSSFGAAQGASRVFFDGVTAAVTAWSQTALTVVVPDSLVVGAHAVSVSINGQASNIVPFAVNSAPPPAIATISPLGGAAGTVITVSGTRFGATQGASSVALGGVTVTPVSWSNTSLAFAIPATVAAGNPDIVVTVNGSASAGYPVTVWPTLSGLNPPAGVAGAQVAIVGTNFGNAPNGSAISIGGVAATPSAWSATVITAAVPPPLGLGTHPVFVTVGGQISNSLPFAVVGLTDPVLTALTPAMGMAGSGVTASGANFGASQGTSKLIVGSAEPASPAWSDSSIGFAVPALAPGTYLVQVTTGVAASNRLAFTVTTPTSPWIAGVTPLSGSTGTVLTVSGSKFGATQGASKLILAGLAAPVAFWSDTQLTVAVPAGAPAGFGAIFVEVGGEASNSYPFTVRPTVQSVSPATAIGGQAITLAGANFGAVQGASQVTVGGVVAAVDAWSETVLVVRVPVSLGAGLHAVFVEVNSQLSNGASVTSLGLLRVTSVNPTTGSAGAGVTLGGTNFGTAQGLSTLLLGGTPVTPTGWSDTALTFTVPAAVAAGVHSLALTVNGVAANAVTFTVVPSLRSAAPTGGPAGTFVALGGANFGTLGFVHLSGTPLAAQSWASDTVTFIVPNLPAGAYSLDVESGGQTSNTLPFLITAPGAAAIVGGIAPASAMAGDTVTLSGINFGATQDASEVWIGATTVAADAWSDGVVSFTVPLLATGSYPVWMVVGGAASNQVSLAVTTPTSPRLTALSPSAGSAGTPIRLTGTNLGSSATGSLTLGGAPAATSAWSATDISASVPASLTAGLHNVIVVNNGEASNTLTFAVRPVITDLSPIAGGVGAGAVITGSGFGDAAGLNQVLIDGVPAPVVTWSATSIAFTIPSVVRSGVLPVVVSVNGQVSNARTFTVSGAAGAVIDSLAPGTGVAGALVTVAGSRFGSTASDSTVSFGGLAPTVVSWSNSSVVLEVPAGLAAGAQPIVVTVGGVASNAATFTVLPSLLTVTPPAAAAGAVIQLTGTGFAPAQGASRVWLGAIAVPVAAWSSSALAITVPASLAAGSYSIGLQVNGQWSNALPFTLMAPGAPVLFGAVPASAMQGTLVTVSGANLGSTPGALTLGGNAVAASAWSQTGFQFTVPSVATGTYDLVATVNGTASNLFAFSVTSPTSPWINALNPAAGSVGTAFTAGGVRFGAVGSLWIDGLLVTPTAWAPTSILAAVPAGVAAGNRSVVVAAGGENSNTAWFTVRPEVFSVVPAAGIAGAIVTITGTGFGSAQGSGSVSFGGVNATVNPWTDGSLTVSVPSGVAAGSVAVVVTQGGQPSNSVFFDVTSAPAPTIASLSLTVAAAGQQIIVTGRRFGLDQGVSTVTLGGTPLSATSWTNTSLTFTVPDSVAAGAQAVIVTVDGKPSNAVVLAVVPTVTAVAPAGGAVGAAFTVTGSNFGAAQGASSLTVGGVVAAVTAWSPFSISGNVPSVALGSQPVVAMVGAQPSNAMAYFVTTGTGPVITAVAPSSGFVGATVTLSGVNLGSPGTLLFGGSGLSPISWSPTQVQFSAPPVPTGSYEVLLVTSGGTSNPVFFTLVTPTSPWVTGVAPNVGEPNTVVSLTGLRFGAFPSGSTVTVGGVGAIVQGWTDTGITVAIPPGVTAGIQGFVVTVGGQASNSAAFTVRPTLLSLSPAVGSIGAPLTIAGAGFGAAQGGSAVWFSGTPAGVVSWSPASIGATVPTSLSAGAHAVFVTVNGQPSNSLAYVVTTGSPVITGVNPTAGAAGTSVVVAGVNFGATQGGNTLQLGGRDMGIIPWADDSVTFVVPSDIAAGPQSVVVTVAGMPSPADVFTVVPTLASVAPSPAVAGNTVTLTGANFGATQDTSTLTLGGTGVIPTGWSHTSITFVVPDNLVSGSRTVALTVGGQTVQGSLTVQPTITLVTPAQAAAPASMSVAGTNFGFTLGASTASLGGVNLVPAGWSATGFSFAVPANVGAGTQTLALTVAGLAVTTTVTIDPAIASVAFSPATGGEGVVVTGSNFGATQGASSFTLLGVAITPTVWSQTSLTFMVPDNLPAGAGTLDLSVRGRSVSAPFTVRPTISSVSPSSATSGTTVTLEGSNFGPIIGTSTFTLGGNTVAPAAWSDTAISFVLPSYLTAGPVTATVTVNGQAASAPFAIDPKISSLTPTVGTAGTSFTVTGANFGDAQGTSGLTVGGVGIAAAAWSQTSITFVLPSTVPGGAQTLAVTVNGRAASTAVTVNPYIASVTPAAGPVGTSVTLSGTNFAAVQGTSVVTLGGVIVAPTAWSDTSITFAVPATAAPGPQSVQVTVGGRTVIDSFSVNPTVSGIAPAAGSFGDNFVVTGANFGSSQGTSTVSVGGVLAAVSAWNGTALTFVMPADVAGGVKTVTLSIAGQPVTTTVTVVPKISGRSPAAGASGAAVNVTGGNFGAAPGASTLTLGGAVLSPTAWNHTNIGFNVPSNIEAGVRSLVATVGGQAGSPVTFTVNLSVSGVTPSPATTGSLVTVAGANFGAAQGGSSLTVGGVGMTPATWTHTAITFYLPAGVVAGNQTVALTVGGQTVNTALVVRPTIFSLNPSAGSAGTIVNVDGGNFGATRDASTFTLGGITVTPTSWSDASIEFIVPAGVSAGAQNLVVSVGGQTASTTFNVTGTLGGIAPASGSAGTLVSVSGSNFGVTQATSTVTLGGVAQTPTSWSDTQIQLVVGSDVKAGVQSLIVNVGGSESSAVFTVLPSISSATPGTATGGDVVTLGGTNFGATAGSSTVTVGGVSAVASSWSHTALDLQVPANVTAGTRTLVVTVGGQSTVTNIVVTPTLNTVAPASGPSGTLVTLSGSNFGSGQGGSTLSLGGVSLTPSLWTQTQIQFGVPANVGGGTQTLALTVGGQGATASFDVVVSVAGVAPPSGATGTAVTLSGANFGAGQGSSTLTIGGLTATPSSWSQTGIQFVVPAAVPGGAQSVVVTVGGYSAGGTFTVMPTLTAVSPTPAVAGDTISVGGSGFGAAQGLSSLTVGGITVVAATWSAGAIDFVLPSSVTAGTRNVTVSVGGQAVSAVLTVKPRLNSVAPASGAAGTSVLLGGTSFGADAASGTLTLGGAGLTATNWSATSLSFDVPVNVAAGTQSLVLTVGGQTTMSTFTVDPSIAGVAPASGAYGTAVTVSGANFGNVQGGSFLTLAGRTIVPSVWSSTSIQFTVPNNVTAGTQSLVVTVGGRIAATAFTVAPLLTAVTPNSGTGGVSVAVSGAGFGAAQGFSAITLGGATVSPTGWSDTSIQFVVPTNAPAGVQSLVVTVGGQAVNASFTVTPTISAVTPSSGVAGIPVVLSGSNFGASQGGSTLRMAGIDVPVTSWNSTSITFNAPSNVTAGAQTIALTVGVQNVTTVFTLQPSISAVTPGAGGSGANITLSGANFGAAYGTSTLRLDGQDLAPSAWSMLTVTFTMPSDVTAGTQPLTIVVGGQTASTTFNVTHNIDSLSPTNGVAGTLVSVVGGNFGAAQGASSVSIGGLAVTPLSWSDTSVTFVVPSNVAAGASSVVLTVGTNTSTAIFNIRPSIASVTPSSGGTSTAVVVTGANFGATQGGSVITLGGVPVAVSSWSHTSVDFTVPDTVTAGTRTLAFSIGGQVTTATFNVPLSLTSVAPNNGAAGTAVTISGENFGSTKGFSTLTLGGLVVPPGSWTSGSIAFGVSNNVTAGAQTISLTVGGKNQTAAFLVKPSISAVTPGAGGSGDSITLSGANFGDAQAGSTLSLAGLALTASAWSMPAIDFTVPSSVTAGTQSVVLIIAGQTVTASLTVTQGISSLVPSTGSAGTLVTVSGANFGAAQGASSLSLGGIAVTPGAWSPTVIQFTVPNNVAAGVRSVVLTVNGQTSSAPFTVTPSITLVSPGNGAGGAAITLSGSNFGAAKGSSSLWLDGASPTVIAWSDTSIIFTVPHAVTAGTQTITLTVGMQSVATNLLVNPAITAVTPGSGGSGTVVTVDGSGFGASQGVSTLTLGGIVMTPSSWGATALTFTLPSSVTAGAQTLALTVAGQTVTSAFTATHAVTGVSPGSGSAGTAVALTGTNFGATQGANTLAVGGVAVTPTSWSNTAIAFTLPNNVTSGTQPVAVTVGGATAAANFTVTPTVAGLAPSPVAAGGAVTLTGTNFGAVQNGSTLTVGGATVSVTAWGHTSISFTAPGSVTAGVQTVLLTVGSQTASTTLTLQPSIAAATPNTGGAGTNVTLTGANFGATQGASTLTLGGVGITPSFWSMNSLVFTVPSAVTAGTQSLVVVVSGQSASVTFTATHAITSLTPSSGTAGATVSIAGANFGTTQGASTLAIGGVAVTPLTWSDGAITFTVPNNVPGGVRAVTVTVAGTGVSANFTVQPSIATVTPNAGGTGTSGTVTGTNFGSPQGTSSLTLAGVTLSPTSWTHTSLGFTVPNAVTAGTQTLAIIVGGESVTASFDVPLAITGIAPANGVSGAGVTLSGSNFGSAQGGSVLTLGAAVLTPTSWSAGAIVFAVPNSVTAGTQTVSLTVGAMNATTSFLVQPSIGSVNPNSGNAGTPAAVLGANFGAAQGTSTLTIGGVPITPAAWTMTSIDFTLPGTVTAGTQPLVVTVNGQVAASVFSVTQGSISLMPTAGGVGTSVAISGSGFGATQGASVLTLGGLTLTPDSWSDTAISFTVPSNVAGGAQSVVVTVGGVPASATFTVHPSIASLTPSTGSAGTGVTVTGANFGATQGASSLRLDGATLVPTSWSHTSLLFSVPSAVTAGTQTLTVTVGSQVTTATFDVTPTLASLAPAAGTTGTSITLTGTNFGAAQGGSTLSLGALSVTPTSWSAGAVVFALPSNIVAGAQTVTLTVGGHAVTANVTVQPSIGAVTPSTGGAGAAVTLTGANFGATRGSSTLTLGGVVVSPSSWSMTAIGFAVPATLAAGTQAIVVSVGGQSASASFTVGHAITGLAPSSATATTLVTVSGENLGSTQGTSSISLGGITVAPVSWSATSLSFAVPATIDAGVRTVVVTVAGAASNALPLTVQPSLYALTPNSAVSGTSITLTGASFGASQGTSVLYVGATAVAPTSWSAGSIAFSLPVTISAGAHAVSVSVGGQASNALLLDVSPTITSLAPTTGAFGTVVTVNGGGFGAAQGTSSLNVGGVIVAPSSWSASALMFTLPATVAAGAQALSVTVGSRTSNTRTFTVTPSIATLTPALGNGGTTISLTGGGFGSSQGASVLSFGGTSLAAATWSDTAITFAAPTTVAAGIKSVTVTVGGQTGNAQSFTLTPYVSGIAPSSGTGGTSVTLSGANFGSAQGTSSLSVGGTNVTPVSWSNSSLTFTVPDALAGGVQAVVVTVGGQTSNSVNFTVQPSITSLTPASGSATTVVTVTGKNFGSVQGASVLTMGGVIVAATAWSDLSLSFAVPATVAAGIQGVQVTVGGQASNTAPFTVSPTLASLTPNNGYAATSVVIAGSNFGASQLTNTVTFGGVARTASSWTNTAITISVPTTLSAGAQTVQVTVGGQVSNTLTYTLKPSITTVSPATGSGGATVTVSGASFGGTQGGSTLTLGAATLTPDAWSSTAVTFTVTNALAAGMQSLIVTVNGQASNSVTFTVAPYISSLTPGSGTAGSLLTIAGTNFGATKGASTVKFDATTAGVISWSNTSIGVTVPTVSAAAYGVTVTVNGVTSNAAAYTVSGIYGVSNAETLDCNPVDGRLDHYRLTLSAAVTDATFDGYLANAEGLTTSRWAVGGHNNVRLHHGTSLPAACGADIANDGVLFLKFDPGAAPDTGVEPDLTATAALVQVATNGKKLYSDTGTFVSADVVETDKAGPYVFLAVASEDDILAGEYGVGPGDTLQLRFSEGTNAPALSGVDVDTLVLLNNGHTFGAAADISSAVWSTSTAANDTLTVTFANANATVAVGDSVKAQGTLVADGAGNLPAATGDVPLPTVITGTFNFGYVGARLLTAQTYDLDGDGFIDHIKLVFDKSVNDTTFPGYVGRNLTNSVASSWFVSGYNNVRLDSDDAVDGAGGASDASLWLKFDEGAYPDTGYVPDVTATPGAVGLRDGNACYINADNNAPGCGDAAKGRLASADVVEGDKAPPVAVRASGKVGYNRVYLSFSEPVWGAMNQPACGAGGELTVGKFTYINANPGGATGLTAMDTDTCAAVDQQVVLLTAGAFVATDMNTDYVGMAGVNVVFDAANNAERTTDRAYIVETTAPYLVAASSFIYGGKSYIRVVYSEPVLASDALTAANYALAEAPANASCADIGATPTTVLQVSSTVYDLETAAQCGPATSPATYYKVTASNVHDVNENELIGLPNFATTLGTDASDITRPRVLEAVALSPLTVRVTFSEPMRSGDAAGSAECAAAFTAGRRCGDDIDAVAGGVQNKYTINPTLGAISQVVATANPSVFSVTHVQAQSGGFYTLTVYASNAVAGIPVDPIGNLLLGKPDNQVTFQGKGGAITGIGDGPLFSDPFVDGTSFSYAFKYANRVYLGPNDANSGAYRFEADGLNPTSVSFLGPVLGAACPYATSFGLAIGGTLCDNTSGPNLETGLVGFDSGTATVASTPYEILMVGTIKNNVSHVYFTQDVDTQLNWISCPLGSYTGGGNTKSVQNTYTFASDIYSGISSDHNTQAPIMLKVPVSDAGSGVLTCATGVDLDLRLLANLGKGGGNPAVNPSSVGIDTMVMVPSTVGAINAANDTFYIANNGGVARSNGTPASYLTFAPVMAQSFFANYDATKAGDNVTLVIDSLGKISPGRKGVPRFVVYKNTLFMARNVAVAQTAAGQIVSAGGELWKCSTNCISSANWTRVFTSSTAGSNTGIENTSNSAVSLLEASGGYLYVAFDNLNDGARVYRTNIMPAGPTDFGEIGRMATAACTNHTGDTGALGGLCHAYQVLSSAAIPKGTYNYLYLTVGCTIATQSVNGGKCDTDATGAFVAPPVRVLMQRD